MLGLKALNSGQRTACGVAVGVMIWAATLGVMLTDPAIKAKNPGVYETMQLFTPSLDPETGERTSKPRQLPL